MIAEYKKGRQRASCSSLTITTTDLSAVSSSDGRLNNRIITRMGTFLTVDN